MAKPQQQPKEPKPKAEGQTSSPKDSDGNSKAIVMTTITTVLICVLFIGANYMIQSHLLNSKLGAIAQTSSSEEGEEEAEAGAESEKGLIVDMGSFTMNLADTQQRRYLKVDVALEVTQTEADKTAAAQPASSGGHGGHGESAAPAVNPIEVEMAQYKPAIRDAIITALSSKTAEELATVPGKELAKEQIAESVDAIFNGERTVIRVSFGQFIMQ